jgi:N-acetylglutamate synthase-like GNAT family acetyltransferase
MIRQFAAADAEACCEVIRACLASDSQLPPSLYTTLQILETPQAMRKRAALFYMAVYESGKDVVGVAGLDMNEVRLLYVSPKHQNQGIGEALLDHLESMVPPSMFADIFVYSTPSAADFYSRRGFKGMGEYSFNLNGEQLRTIFMIKILKHSQRKSREAD